MKAQIFTLNDEQSLRRFKQSRAKKEEISFLLEVFEKAFVSQAKNYYWDRHFYQIL